MGGRNSNLRKALALSTKRKELEAIRAKRVQAEANLKQLMEQIKVQDMNNERDRGLALKKLEEIKKIRENIHAGVAETVKAHDSIGKNINIPFASKEKK